MVNITVDVSQSVLVKLQTKKIQTIAINFLRQLKEIKDLKIFIAKLEEAKISTSQAMNSSVCIDNCKIEVDHYTQNLLQKLN